MSNALSSALGRACRQLETLESRLAPAGLIASGLGGEVRLYETDTGVLTRTLTPFGSTFTGNVNVALADLTGDGVADIIAGAGPGGGPHVRTYDGATGVPLTNGLGSFFAFDTAFRGGVEVAGGDINGDGHADLVVAPGAGGGPHVRAFDGFTGAELRGFFAFDPAFRGGVGLAVGDLNNDGKDEIVAAAGPGGGPHVKVFDGATGATTRSFFAFDPTFTGGVNPAIGRSEGANNELVVAAGPGGGPRVRSYDGVSGALTNDLFVFDAAERGGVSVSPIDTDASANASEYIVSSPRTALVKSGRLNNLRDANVPSALKTAVAAGADVGASAETNLLRIAGYGSYFEGEAKNLPQTAQGAPPNRSYPGPNTPTPNMTQEFLDLELPVQTTDWWSPVTNRSTNHPGPTGWDNGSNNFNVALVADPLVFGLRPDQLSDTKNLQFGVGQNILPRFAYEGRYQVGNVPFGPNDTGIIGASTRMFYRTTPLESNGKLDVQVGVFDPAVPAGPDNKGDGSNAPAQRSVPVTNIAVDNYSDWGATFAWTNDAKTFGMTATGMTGNPYSYYTVQGGKSVELYFGRVTQSVRTDVPVTTKDTLLTTQVLYNGDTDGMLVIAVPQLDSQRFGGPLAYYAFFGPSGSKWNLEKRTTVDGSLVDWIAKAENNLAGKDYFSSVALPSDIVLRDGNGVPILDSSGNQQLDMALLEVFRSHGYAFPTDLGSRDGYIPNTQLIPGYDPSTALVTSTLNVYTSLKEAGTTTNPNINSPLLTLYPHQYDNLNAASKAALAASPVAPYQSPKGELKLFVPPTAVSVKPELNISTLGTELRYRGGILPALPTGISDVSDNDTLLKYLASMAANPYDANVVDPVSKVSGAGNFASLGAGYEGGKRALRIANVLPLFEMVTPTAQYPAAKILEMRTTLLNQVKRFIADFFDATDYKFLLHDTVWDTMLPYPDDGFLAIQKINDHHFHYGYYLHAAGLIARYDPAFVSDAQFGPILKLLIKDVANTDREDTRFPFLRNYQPFLGHSYADGGAGDDQGNNQESSSEAMSFSSGLIMLGEAMMAVGSKDGQTLRDTGVFLFTSEEEAIGQYWFDAEQKNFNQQFTDSYDSTTITANLDKTQTTINVQTNGSISETQTIRLPSVFPFAVQIDSEVMIVTGSTPGADILMSNGKVAKTANWTVTRGAFGSTPNVHWLNNTFGNDKQTFATENWINKVSIKSAPFRASTLSNAIDAAATSMTVADAKLFPNANGFTVSVGNELITVTAGAGTTTWTITRGVEGSTAAAHSSGDAVRLVSPTVITANTIVWGGALTRSNFFAGDFADEPATNFAISWLPVSAASLYQGRYRNAQGGLYARDAYQSMLNMENFLFSTEPVYAAGPYLINVNGTMKGTAGQGGEYPGSIWAYQAYSDPQGSIDALTKYVITPPTPDLIRTQGSPGGFDGLDTGESVAFTFSFAHALKDLGEIDPDAYATGPITTYAVFIDPVSKVRTYVAQNYSTTAAPITFHDGSGTVTITVPARTMVKKVGTAAETVVLSPPLAPLDVNPANRFFLRGEITETAGEGKQSTFLSPTPGTGTNAFILPIAVENGQPRGPDFFPGPVQMPNPMFFEISGVSGTPAANANDPGGPRSVFNIPVINNLFLNPVDGDFNENSALVVVNVAYFANAGDTKASRVEVWSQGPQGIDGNGTVQPGFTVGRAVWQPYYSETWFDRAPGNEKIWFVGDYPEMTDGKVRISVWTINTNANKAQQPDRAQSEIGIRTNSAANQYNVAFVDIPYTNVVVG